MTITEQRHIETHRNRPPSGGVDAELGHTATDHQVINAKLCQALAQVSVVERVAATLGTTTVS